MTRALDRLVVVSSVSGLLALSLFACGGVEGGAPAGAAAPDAGGDDAGGDGAGPIVGNGGTLAITPPAKVFVVHGGSAKVNVAIQRGAALTGPVSVTLAGALDGGVTAAPLEIAGDKASGELEVRAAADTPQGDVAGITVEARASGVEAVSAPLGVFVRGAAGEVDTTFGIGGSLAGLGSSAFALDGAGRIYTAKDGVLARFTADGKADPTFVPDPTGFTAIGAIFAGPSHVYVCGDGTQIGTVRLTPAGKVDASWGSGGFATVAKGAGAYAGCFLSPAGNSVVSWSSGGAPRLSWFNAQGGLGTPTPLTKTFTNRAGYVDAQAFTGAVGSGTNGVARIKAEASQEDATFGGGTVTVADFPLFVLGVPSSQDAYVLTRKTVQRLSAQGTKVATFAAADLAQPDALNGTMAVQPDGKLIVVQNANGAAKVARLLPNGQRDMTFAGTGTITPEPILVTFVGIQPDGRVILVTIPGVPTKRYWVD